jgi:hypothetical protein
MPNIKDVKFLLTYFFHPTPTNALTIQVVKSFYCLAFFISYKLFFRKRALTRASLSGLFPINCIHALLISYVTRLMIHTHPS